LQEEDETLKISIIGAGAMGMLFGGYLSRRNEVMLIDCDEAKVQAVNDEGILIREPDGEVFAAAPKACLPAKKLETADLVLLFVKAMDSMSALEAARNLISSKTYVLSMQNGAGHEAVLREFAAIDRVMLGTTQHNSSIVKAGVIHHGGSGLTCIGLLDGSSEALKPIAEEFTRCGFKTEITENIQKKIWEKLFVNVSASALTAVFQTRLGFLVESAAAWTLTEALIREAVAVANGDGLEFEADKIIQKVRSLLENAKHGITSICADIKDRRKTEVDTISGSVTAASRRNHIPAPLHEFMVQLIHAMEDKKRRECDMS
jgi:2-dehydropantoate 2-reductase